MKPSQKLPHHLDKPFSIGLISMGVSSVATALLLTSAIQNLTRSTPSAVALPTPTPPKQDTKNDKVTTVPLYQATEGFRAAFPTPPTRTVQPVHTPLGTIYTIHYISTQDDVQYAVAYVDYRKVVMGSGLGLLQGIILSNTRAAILNQANAVQTSHQTMRYGSYEGEVMMGKSKSHQLIAKIVVVGKQTYQIVMSAPHHYQLTVNDPFFVTFNLIK